MNEFVNSILDFMLRVIPSREAVTVLIAALPIVEARLALPIGLGLGMSGVMAWLLAFVGSSMLAPLLLLVLIPFIRFLARTRVFRRIGSALYARIEQKSAAVESKHAEVKNGEAESENSETGSENGASPKKKRRLSAEAKKMLGVYLFVALPVPLTGVWTGCAVASVLGLKYPKALVSVLAGNLTASLILWLLCACFAAYIDYIIIAITIIAACAVIALIVKICLYRPKKDEAEQAQKTDENAQ